MRFRQVIGAVFISWYALNFAAGPGVHAYSGHKFIQSCKNYNDQQTKEFIVATLFPDIRYPAGVARRNTHSENVTLEQVLAHTDAFAAGMEFHAFVDEFRAKIVEERDIEELLKSLPEEHAPTFLKLVEDELIYDKISWDTTLKALATFPTSEEKKAQALGISNTIVKEWHVTLSAHFNKRPGELIAECACANKGYLLVSAEIVKVWDEQFQSFVENQQIQEYVNDMLEQFDRAFKRFK